MTKDELNLTLEALEKYAKAFGASDLSLKAMSIVRDSLAQPEHGWTPERIAGIARLKDAQDKKLAQRTWVGLTDEELPPLVGDNGKYMELQQVRRFYKYIEAKLKEKNT